MCLVKDKLNIYGIISFIDVIIHVHGPLLWRRYGFPMRVFVCLSALPRDISTKGSAIAESPARRSVLVL